MPRANDDKFILHEKSLDELYAWIDLVPLNRPKKNISRDFSDAVLCAEVISHFAPRLVELHNYAPANSVIQKKINWTTLNRKVLQKLGLKLAEGTIQQLAESKPGTIEHVLFDIRKKLDIYNAEIVIPPTPSNPPDRRSVTIASSPGQSISSRSTNVSFIRSPARSPSRRGPVEFTVNKDNVPIGVPSSHTAADYEALPVPKSGSIPSSTIEVGNFPASGYQAQASIISVYPPPDLSPPKMVMDPSANDLVPATSVAATTSPSQNNNDPSQLAPSQIIYKGHKMVPQALLDEKDREIKSLNLHVKTLEKKVHRIETLVNVKDQRIEDLTHQLHSVRSTYERVTQQTWTGFA